MIFDSKKAFETMRQAVDEPERAAELIRELKRKVETEPPEDKEKKPRNRLQDWELEDEARQEKLEENMRNADRKERL